MKKRNLDELAGNAAWYPNADELVKLTFEEIQKVVPDSLIPEEVARIVETFFTVMTHADIQGLFSVNDEHEWAYLATVAMAIRMGNQTAHSVIREYTYGDTPMDVNSPYPKQDN